MLVDDVAHEHSNAGTAGTGLGLYVSWVCIRILLDAMPCSLGKKEGESWAGNFEVVRKQE